MDADEPVWGAPATPEALGELVAVLRRRRGLTQAEVAEQAGAPRRFVNELEGGHATLYLRRLFDVLDVLDARLVVAEPEAAGPSSVDTEHRDRGDATAAEAPQLKDLGW